MAERVSAARLNAARFRDFLSDFGGEPGAGYAGIASAAPEYVPAESGSSIQTGPWRKRSSGWVEDIDPVLEEVGDKSGAGAAGDTRSWLLSASE
jgi:hypothetical protein